MGLNKAIEHNKEHRRPYTRAKSVDTSCRNHGSCDYCKGNRTYFDKKYRTKAEEDIQEAIQYGIYEV
jgi:hypothetical protein